MNKALIIMLGDNGQGFVNAGGLDLTTVEGIREALAMTEFARAQMTEALVQLRAKELASEQADASPPERAELDT